jgi:parallel beta-helix repeat protein
MIRRKAATIVVATLLSVTGSLFWSAAPARAAAVLHVPADYATIQAAIDASTAGDTILVAPGTYVERLTIAKDVTVESDAGPETTIIDGATGGRVVSMSGGPGDTPELRGFTIRNGYDGSGPGGVAVGASGIVADNIVADNFGCFGAIAASENATIEDNTITNHKVPCSGGSASILLGGAGTVKVLRNLIVANHAGGITLNAAGSPTIDRNVIADNEGSGVELGNDSNPSITNNLIAGNAAYAGGGISMLVPSGSRGPYVINNTFVGNTATHGSAIYADGFDAGSKIVDNVIVAATAGPALECTFDFDPAYPTIAFNDIVNSTGPSDGGACTSLAGTNGNVSVAPGFRDAANGDYHLRPDSPLVDAGTNVDAPATDIDGDARPFDGNLDSTATVDPGFDEATDPVLVDPAAVAFGNVGLGLSSAPKAVTVSNFGASPFTVDSAALSGADAAAFHITSETCTAGPIASTGSCSITLTFGPGRLGAHAATLTVSGPDPVGSRTVALTGTGVAPPSGVAWSTTTLVGPAYTWNGGNALARTVQSGAQRLHAAYATDRIGSSWARDAGPYAGVYYVRNSSGTTWSTPKRLNPSTQHAIRLGLAASGSRVYATWVSQTRIIRYSGTAPRVLYVRVNTNHGSSTAWKTAIRLSSTTGRVDYPTVAASSPDVHVAWTNSATGEIKITTSHDSGTTWKSVTIGTTTLSSPSGRIGLPSVAVSGSTVAVSWLADASGTVKVRVSTNRGVTWGSIQTVGGQSVDGPSTAVAGSRIAVAWTTPDDVVVRQRISGTWQAARVVSSLTPGGDPMPYAPKVALNGTTRIAVTWAAETDAGYANLNWAESANGSLWFAEQTVGPSTVSSRRLNDYPSVVWASTATRYVVWNGWTSGTLSYRLYLRRGTGTPIGPAIAAPIWRPSSTRAVVVDPERFEPSAPSATRAAR